MIWEDAVVCIGEASTRLITERSDLCLVGTLLTRRPFNVDAMKGCLLSVWKPTKGMQMRVIGDNLFVFSFGHVVDKRRVLLNEPWTFDKHLLMLGEMDPKVQPSDIRLDGGLAWGRSMRIRVSLDVRKPLRHSERDCDAKISAAVAPIAVPQYGPWLRMDNFRSKGVRRSGLMDGGDANRPSSGDLTGAVADRNRDRNRDRLGFVREHISPMINGVNHGADLNGATNKGSSISSPIHPLFELSTRREIEEVGCNRLDQPSGKEGLGVIQPNLGELNKVVKKKWKRAARLYMGTNSTGPFDTGPKRAFDEEMLPG
ncbi:unnamed protein product [Camellia sinensis]